MATINDSADDDEENSSILFPFERSKNSIRSEVKEKKEKRKLFLKHIQIISFVLLNIIILITLFLYFMD